MSPTASSDWRLGSDWRMSQANHRPAPNAAQAASDTAESAYADSKRLIARWHERGRLHYAITPRFAPTSTPAQLEAAAALWREHPTTYLHTHLSENPAEIDWVLSLFPGREKWLSGLRV